MDTRTDDEPAKPRATRRKRLSAASGLFNRLLQRALGTIRAPAANPNKLVLEAFEPRVLLAGDPAIPRIDGNLDVAGETDRYAFTLDEGLRVVFDSLTNNGNIRWSLDGPRGRLVSDRPFSQSDSADRGGDVAYDLPSGDYVISVDGVGDTTGAYAFRLIDINAATELTPGTAVSGELSPSTETDAYKFSVVAGERFYFDRLSHSNDLYWRLLDPFGRTVAGPQYMGHDLGELTLTLDGSYTLLVEGRSYSSGTAAYSFNVVALSEPAPQPMTLGELVRGRIAGAGLRQTFEFTLASSTRTLFDSLTNNYYLNWSLAGADGVLVSGRRLQSSDSWEIGGNPALLLAAGDYTLTIDGEGDATGDFSFRLLDFAAAEALTPGELNSGALGEAALLLASMRRDGGAPIAYPAGQANRSLELYGAVPNIRIADAPSLQVDAQFSVEAWIRPTGPGSDSVYGGIIANKEGEYQIARFADGSIQWALANAAPGWDWVDTGYIAAQGSWTHIALVYDEGQVRTYANGVLVHSFDGSGDIGDVDGRNALQFGSREAGGQQFQGQLDDLRVWNVARSDAQIAGAFDQLLAGDEAGLVGHWRLDEADGSTLADSSAAAANPGVLTAPPATETRLYRFDAAAGARYFFDARSLAGDNFSVRLFGPDGSQLAGPQWFTSDLEVFTATLAGRYTLAFEGRIFNGSPATYAFVMQPVVDGTQALALDSTVGASIEHAGQQQRFNFTLAADKQLVFDSLTDAQNLNWSLLGPNGAIVSARTFYSSDSGELGGSTALRLAAGDYQVVVDGVGDATGAFAFRLLDLAAADALAYGAATVVTLNPGNQTKALRIKASAGDEVLFDWTSMSGGNAYWRLLDPTGALVFGPDYLNADRGPFSLRLDGDYVLLIEGRVFETAEVNVGFTVTLNGNTPIPAPTGTAIDLGVRVDGTLGAAGEIDDYVFDVAAPMRLYFDAFAPNNGAFRWSLVGPRGDEVSGRSIYYSESYEFGAASPVRIRCCCPALTSCAFTPTAQPPAPTASGCWTWPTRPS